MIYQIGDRVRVLPLDYWFAKHRRKLATVVLIEGKDLLDVRTDDGANMLLTSDEVEPATIIDEIGGLGG